MAICSHCNQEMTKGMSCTPPTPVVIGGQSFDPVPNRSGSPCHDCRTPAGGLHHPGCDDERCPKCGGQLISCGCLRSDEDEL